MAGIPRTLHGLRAALDLPPLYLHVADTVLGRARTTIIYFSMTLVLSSWFSSMVSIQ
jgi:hypothetical protein